MAGVLMPLVMLSRYSTYVGASTFQTVAMDVTQYSGALVNVWRGKLTGTTPTIAFIFKESSDQVTWSTVSGGSSFDPAEETEVLKTLTLTKKWLRIEVTLGGTLPGGTCYAVGFLEERVS